MVFREVTIARQFTRADAQRLVSRCMHFDSEITFEMGSKKINAKSLMGVISMVLKAGDEVTVITKGDDQEEALEAAVKALSVK